MVNSYNDLFELESFKELHNIIKNSDESNIFKILKLQNYEIRHSNYLAWLLDPKKSHGLNNTFLKKIFETIGKKVEIPDFFEVHTEYPVPKKYEGRKKGRIDILIIADNFVCVIENKYGSKEHNKQCKRYKAFVNEEFKQKDKIFIYLDIFPKDKKLFEEGQPLCDYELVTYEDLLGVLPPDLYKEPKNDNEIAINTIFHQYREILNSNYKILNDNDKLSKKIKKFLKGEYILKQILKVCKEDKDKMDECNTIWTIQSYLWTTCHDRANKLIDELRKELKLKLDDDKKDNKYVVKDYGILKCIPNDITEVNNVNIVINNNLEYKDYGYNGINICIVDNSGKKYPIHLINTKNFIEYVLENDDDEKLLKQFVNDYEEEIKAQYKKLIDNK